MPLPSIIFGVILSSLYGALFHLWRGGNLGRLILYIISSWIGFWGGHVLGGQLGWSFANVGALNTGAATLGSILFLGLGYWLSLVQVDRH